MHLALLISAIIVLCSLDTVVSGPRSKKRGKSHTPTGRDGVGEGQVSLIHDFNKFTHFSSDLHILVIL